MKRTIIHFFILLACTTWLRAEELIIKGKVINQDGEAIPGAIITVDEWQRNKTQYITDSEGRYTFSINSSATFQVTADGYTSSAEDSDISGFCGTELNIVLYNAIIFKAGQQSSIVLPTAPDPSLGKYYRLDRVEGNNIIFERELHPKANVPYVFVAHNDVRIDVSGMDLTQKAGRVDIKVTAPKEGSVTFMGSYSTYNCAIPGSDIWWTFFSELPNNYEPRLLEAMQASLVYEWWLFDRTPELVFNDSEETNYRPFIEEGKVWKVGNFGTYSPEGYTHAHTIEYFYFDGDTIVSGRQCKKMMCLRERDINWYYYQEPQTIYVGALYEDVHRVYCALPNSGDFVLLYDFTSPEETEIEYYNTDAKENTRGYIRRRNLCEDNVYHGMITTVNLSLAEYSPEVPYFDLPEVSVYWREGVGYNGFYNSEDIMASGGFYQIMLCTVDDEVLYYDPSLIDCVTPDDSEVKKNTIDFTHVVKAQPKAPRSLSPSSIPEQSSPTRSLSPVREGSEEAENLTGEYSIKELFVNFKPLAGPYVITICDGSGTVVYRKEVQTNNVIGLNTDISGYEKGTYTLTVENDEEVYTAKFNIDDVVGIGRPTPDPSRQGGEKAGAVYDLSGRKIGDLSSVTRHSSLPKGVYIKAGRKVVVR